MLSDVARFRCHGNKGKRGGALAMCGLPGFCERSRQISVAEIYMRFGVVLVQESDGFLL